MEKELIRQILWLFYNFFFFFIPEEHLGCFDLQFIFKKYKKDYIFLKKSL